MSQLPNQRDATITQPVAAPRSSEVRAGIFIDGGDYFGYLDAASPEALDSRQAVESLNQAAQARRLGGNIGLDPYSGPYRISPQDNPPASPLSTGVATFRRLFKIRVM